MTGKQSYVVHKERCPECAKSGKDRRGDNLAVYNDGHSYCFSCGYRTFSDKTHLIKSLTIEPQAIEKDWSMPEDTDTTIGLPGLLWLRSYGITNTEIFANKILWSEERQWLIFPFYHHNVLIGWQARNFNKDKPYKWLTKGEIKGHLLILNNRTGYPLVLVEDIVSAIKVSRYTSCCCLFGSFISSQFLTRLRYTPHTDLYIWLDPDKQKEAITFSAMANLFGFNCKVLLTDKDPKEHTDAFIQEVLPK